MNNKVLNLAKRIVFESELKILNILISIYYLIFSSLLQL